MAQEMQPGTAWPVCTCVCVHARARAHSHADAGAGRLTSPGETLWVHGRRDGRAEAAELGSAPHLINSLTLQAGWAPGPARGAKRTRANKTDAKPHLRGVYNLGSRDRQYVR